MSHESAFVNIVVALASMVCGCCALAQTEREVLLEISSHYESVNSASLYAEATLDNGSHLVAIDVTVNESGAFSTLHFDDINPPLGLTWDERPGYFVYFDGEHMNSARGSGSSYERTTPDSAYAGIPPPIQHVLAPWPFISQWAKALSLAEDTVFTTSQDGLRGARSVSLGIGVQWDEQMRIRAVVRSIGNGDASMDILFEGYDAQFGKASRPTTLRQIFRNETGNDEKASAEETTYAITRFALNPADIADRLIFDAKTLHVNRFDRATSNVYSPDGDLLFNEDEFYKAYLAANRTRRLRPWMIVVLVSLFLGSGYIAYRRFGPRLGGGDGGNKA